MKFLNGIVEKSNDNAEYSLLIDLPEAVSSQLLAKIHRKIERMNKNYHLYKKRNELLSDIAKLKHQVNSIENEINGI